MSIGILASGFLVLLLAMVIYTIFGLGVKYTFIGSVMTKYAILAFIVKIGIIVGIGFAIIPYYEAIATHVNLNQLGEIDYWLVLKNCGLMVLMAVIGIAVEAFFAFEILIPLAKKVEF